MNNKPNSPHVFLSYSRDDTHFMMRIRDALKSKGIRVWTDEGLTPGTESWKRDIENAIRDSLGIVVILSPSAKQSMWVERELGFASAQGKRVFPILVHGDTTNAIPIDLINFQWIDIRNEANFSTGMQNLVWALQNKPRTDIDTIEQQSTKASSERYSESQSTNNKLIISAIVIGICFFMSMAVTIAGFIFGDEISAYLSPSKTTTPQATETISSSPPTKEPQGNADAATLPPSTQVPTPIPTSTNESLQGFEECIFASAWLPYPANSPTSTDGEGCLDVSNLGFYSQNQGVNISVQNPNVGQRYGIYTRIDGDVLIELDVRIDQLKTDIVDQLGSLGFGIMTLNPRNTETDGFIYFVIENPDPTYPVYLKKKERGGFEQYIQISGDYFKYPLGTTQKLSLVLEGNRLTIYIDGDFIRETSLPNEEYAFFIGYKFENTGNLSAQISNLSIQEKQ